jgi:hypothetical protein
LRQVLSGQEQVGERRRQQQRQRQRQGKVLIS